MRLCSKNAIAIGIGVKDNQVIDQVNIYEATKLAMMEAIGQLDPQPQHLLIDAMRLDLPISQTSIIKGCQLLIHCCSIYRSQGDSGSDDGRV